MKKYCLSILTALMAILCVSTFVSCGDDDEPGEDDSRLTIGVHRVDVEFEGNTTPWLVTVGFSAVEAAENGIGASLYENGKLLGGGEANYAEYVFRSYSVYTDDNCMGLCCVIDCRTNTHTTPLEPIKIKLKGYVNNKLTKEQTVVCEDNGKSKIIAFYTEGDNVGYVKEI